MNHKFIVYHVTLTINTGNKLLNKEKQMIFRGHVLATATHHTWIVTITLQHQCSHDITTLRGQDHRCGGHGCKVTHKMYQSNKKSQTMELLPTGTRWP